MMKKTLLAMACLLLVIAGNAPAKEVLINPITPDIRDRLKKSTELVSKVEDGMAPKVSEMEKIYKTFKDSCEGNEKDRGCVEIQNQIGEKYKEILSTMSGELPKVKNAIASTARDLGMSIQSKTRNRDIKDLYENISRKGKLPKVRGPLSKKLSEFLKALGRPNANFSVLELSLQTQADMIAASEILEYLEAEISRQMVMVDVVQDFGVLSPQMASVMKGVANLFGYEFDPGVWIEVEETTSGADWRD